MHPPFMAFLWHWLDLVVANPGIFLALQLAVFWLGCGILFFHLAWSRLAVVIGTLLALTYPFLVAYSAVVLKDVAAGDFAFLGFCLLVGYGRTQRQDRLVALSFACFALAGLLRYQLWIAAGPALAAVLIYDRVVAKASRGATLRHLVIAIMAMVVPVVSAQTAMRATFAFQRSAADRLMEHVLLYDIAAVIARAPDIPLEHFSEIGIDVDGLRVSASNLYSTERLDSLWDGRSGSKPISAFLGSMRIGDLGEQWWQLFSRDPLPLVQHRIATFSRLLGFGNIWPCYPLASVGFPLSAGVVKQSLLEVRDPTELWQRLPIADLHPAYAVSLLRSRYFPAGTVIFRPGFYLGVSVVLFALLMRERLRDTIFELSIIAAAWLYWLSFAATPVACDVRYSYFSCLAVMLAALLWLARRLRSPEQRTVSA
jgi:hypothetical protein